MLVLNKKIEIYNKISRFKIFNFSEKLVLQNQRPPTFFFFFFPVNKTLLSKSVFPSFNLLQGPQFLPANQYSTGLGSVQSKL